MLNNEKFDFLSKMHAHIEQAINMLKPESGLYANNEKNIYIFDKLTLEERDKMLAYLINLYIYTNDLMEEELVDDFYTDIDIKEYSNA